MSTPVPIPISTTTTSRSPVLIASTANSEPGHPSIFDPAFARDDPGSRGAARVDPPRGSRGH
eukprot:3934437-Prorocentrum_lima.AAC.1